MAGEVINVDALLESLDYSRQDNDLVQKAFSVMREVNVFLRERKCSIMPSLEISPTTISLSVGDFCCWHSENDDSDSLTAGAILSVYEAECRERMQGFDLIEEP